jgi:hypothetical protein
MPDRRRTISAAQLHELLAREFERTAAGLCGTCRVPRPVFLESSARGPNWRLPALGECAGLCHTILEDVAAKLARDYDVKRPAPRERDGPPVGA